MTTVRGFLRRGVLALFAGYVMQPADVLAQAYELTPSVPSGQVVGTTVVWTVTGGAGGNVDYRLRIGRDGNPMQVRYDFSDKTAFDWTPIEDGVYAIQAVIRDHDTQQATVLTDNFSVDPIAVDAPVVSNTKNPLVALYSAQPCNAGDRMRVRFTRQNALRAHNTHFKPCDGTRSMNFYVAGMLADAIYILRHQVVDAQGQPVEQGPARVFQTGQPTVEMPVTSVVVPAGQETSTLEDVILWAPTPDAPPNIPFATDLNGNVIWYYENDNIDEPYLINRLLSGGTILLNGSKHDFDQRTCREIDLAGNTIREMTGARVSEMLQAQGLDPLGAIHHECRLLPNGQTVIIGSVERILVDVQGPGPVDVIGDYIVALDRNWQVVWAWNAFDHLDPSRAAILGETCGPGSAGCPPVFLAEEGNDWLHANAIGYSPADGNLVFSMRHMDWVIKIDYQDGSGSGAVLWTLGNEGDFTPVSNSPEPWFSHQHDANYVGDNLLTLFDNGNAVPSCQADSAACRSRGQVWELDEINMIATEVLNTDLGSYSFALGSAQNLANGNYHFNSGIQDFSFATADEVNPDGDIVLQVRAELRVYRSFRVRDLYTPPVRE